MKATWNGAIMAQSDATVEVEGNHYFPPASINREYFQSSDTRSHCGWKGDSSYYHLSVDGESNADAAWYYPEPYAAAEQITDYVAFWKGVEVTE